MWCSTLGGTITTQQIPALLIRKNEQNIRFLLHTRVLFKNRNQISLTRHRQYLLFINQEFFR